MTPQTERAVEFLRMYEPSGPWCLTSISPNKHGLETKTFMRDDVEEMERWIKANNGTNNLYFSVNPVMSRLNKKAERKDIDRVSYFHVDIDAPKLKPPEGFGAKELENWRPDPKEAARYYQEQSEEIEARFSKSALKKVNLPPPTFLIFSGGGFQAFWKLKEPIRIDGDIAKAEDAARYNKAIELALGGDHCHNVDRIMRLPGTINVPDFRKRKAGRTPMLASVYAEDLKFEYDLTDFKPYSTDSTLKDSDTIEIGNLPPLSSLDDLDEWNVGAREKIIIAQGRDPDNPKEKDNSRSAWVWDVLMNLARAGVPPNVMTAVLMNPEWRISDSILDKRRPRDIAEEHVRRAITTITDGDDLVQMNNEWFISAIKGKVRVCREKLDPSTGRLTLELFTIGDFRAKLGPQEVEVGKDKKGKPILVNKADWWLAHPKRRQYEGIIFYPNADAAQTKGYYNLWRGFGVEPRPGGSFEIFMNHCRDNLCDGNEEVFKFLLGWMANMIQEPAKPGYSAVVLKGDQGAGKGTFASTLGKLLGRHYAQVANSSHLVGNFNAHLQDTVLLFADEAFYAGDKKHESVLKTLITEKEIPIERKGFDLEMARNCLHIIMATNDFHVIPAGRHERRYLMLDINNRRRQDSAYFGKLKAELEDGGYEALLHYLLHYDLTDFDPHEVPKTAELRQQQELGLGPQESWWLEKLRDGTLIDGEWAETVAKERLQHEYWNDMNITRQNRAGNRISFGRKMKQLVPGIREVKRDYKYEVTEGGFIEERVAKNRPHYVFPPLDFCRDAWVKLHGPTDWFD